jgi:hypothetical protein
VTRRNERSIIVGAVIAGALAWSLPAAADTPAPVRLDMQKFGITGRTLTDEEMSDMRGRFARASIRVGDVVTTDEDPANPGSASVTVNLGGGAVSRAFASTSGTGGSARSTSTVSITGTVTLRSRP